MKYLDRIANIAIIVAVAVSLGVVIRGELAKHQQPDNPSKALMGRTISLPGVHFRPDRNSLVIAISTGCHFCQDSLPFYKDFAAKSQGRVDLVAVLPPSRSRRAKPFFKKLELRPPRSSPPTST
ncbi:MAG: hypothetical protein ABSE99_09795 [Terracidiphilus sp.]|jgi:hypothetical protein